MIGLAITIAATMGLLQQQPQQLVYASSMGSEGGGEEESESNTQEEGEGGSDCSTVQASDPELKGWLIETCGNGDVTWISPSGTRCVANEASNVLGCDDMQVMKGLQGGARQP